MAEFLDIGTTLADPTQTTKGRFEVNGAEAVFHRRL